LWKSWSVSQSGASSVGPSEQVGGEGAAFYFSLTHQRSAKALAGCRMRFAALWQPQKIGHEVSKTVPEAK
jgi:hypothetical protein